MHFWGQVRVGLRAVRLANGYKHMVPPVMFVGLETMIPPMNTTVSIVLSSSI